jgi:hypothetical protein
MDGYVVCNDRYTGVSPRWFPIWNRKTLSMLAPFWADASALWYTSCNGNDGSGVFYRVIEDIVDTENTVQNNEDPEKLAVDQDRLVVLARARKHAALRDDEFEVSSVIIVTWHRMRRFQYYWRRRQDNQQVFFIVT